MTNWKWKRIQSNPENKIEQWSLCYPISSYIVRTVTFSFVEGNQILYARAYYKTSEKLPIYFILRIISFCTWTNIIWLLYVHVSISRKIFPLNWASSHASMMTTIIKMKIDCIFIHFQTVFQCLSYILQA